MRHLKFLFPLIAGVLLAAVGGCKQEQPSPYTEALGSAHGREVAVLADGPVSVRPQEDYLSVILPGHLVIIRKDRLLVDAEERGTFPATSTRFHVVFTNSTLLVMANGAEVLKTELAGKPGKPAVEKKQ